MGAQLSLFGMPSQGNSPPAKAVPEKQPERYRHSFPFEKISSPCGPKDKRGLYAYESLHRKMEKINPKARVLLFQLMQEYGIDLMWDMIEIGAIWKKQPDGVRMDYEDSVGWFWGG